MFLARRVDHTIAISRAVEEEVVAAGLPRERLSTVYLGVDFDDLRARVVTPRAVVRGALEVDAETILVAMVGNLRRWKGQHVVLSAVALLPKSIRDRMRLVFVGAASSTDAPYVAELEAMVANFGLGDRVTFLGSRTDVPDLLAASDIALHASIYPEPFGLVVPEAMALGNAVVAAAAGGPLEILTPESGLLFDTARPQDLADHLASLVTDRSRRDAIASAAVTRAELYSIFRHVAGNIAVYDAVLRGTDAC